MEIHAVMNIPDSHRMSAADIAEEDAIRQEVEKRIDMALGREQMLCDFYETLMKNGTIERDVLYEGMKANGLVMGNYALNRMREKDVQPFWSRDFDAHAIGNKNRNDYRERIENEVRKERRIKSGEWRAESGEGRVESGEVSAGSREARVESGEEREKRDLSLEGFEGLETPEEMKGQLVSDILAGKVQPRVERQETSAEKPRFIPSEEVVKEPMPLDGKLHREQTEEEKDFEAYFKKQSEMLKIGGWDTDYSDLFELKSMNEALADALALPPAVDLYKTLWTEGELCFLYADSNIGKSILAVQIGNELAENRKVMYCDFEMEEPQLPSRYASEDRVPYHFSNRLKRIGRPDMTKYPGKKEEDIVIPSIVQKAFMNDIKTIIVDNIGWLCNDAADGKIALKLMKELKEAKGKFGLSILVLAHTPKRDEFGRLKQNDLAGSKVLMNYCDAAFAIGRCQKDESMRYLKQIKVRSHEMEYGSDNVILMELIKEDKCVKFVERGFAKERDVIKETTEKDEAEMIRMVRKMLEEGLSMRTISSKTGLTRYKVSVIQQHLKSEEPEK